MNKIYKVIWSKVRNCYVAVSEIAKRNGKSCTSVNCGAKANRSHVALALSLALCVTGGAVFTMPQIAWADGSITVRDAGNPPESVTNINFGGSYTYYYPDPSINPPIEINIVGGQTSNKHYVGYASASASDTISGYTLNVSGTDTKIPEALGVYIRGGSLTASGNSVKVSNGASIDGDNGEIAGAKIDKGTAQGNTVTIEENSYAKGTVIGGWVTGSGDVKGNRVTISGIKEGKTFTVESDVLGGYVGFTSGSNGDADSNIVTISDAIIKGNVYGGKNNSGNITKNQIKISGSSVKSAVYGGSSNNDSVSGNIITIIDSTVGGEVTGGNSGLNVTDSKVSGNQVSISGTDSDNITTISGNVIGGQGGGNTNNGNVVGGTGDDEGNTVTLSGYTKSVHVFGGYSNSRADIVGNAVTMTGGESGYVFGGNGAFGSVTGNTVTIDTTADEATDVKICSVYGGGATTGTASGNEVSIRGSKATITGSGSEYGTDRPRGVYGGSVGTGISSGNKANKNTVTISNGATVSTLVYGGYSKNGNDGDGEANYNNVDVSGSTVSGYVMGGRITGNGNANYNGVAINNSSLTTNSTNYITGGRSVNGNADSNMVTIGGSTIMASGSATVYIYGGRSDNNTASGNVVEVDDSTVDGEVTGGRSNLTVAGSKISGNQVSISGKDADNITETGAVYGGYNTSASGVAANVKVGGEGEGNTVTISGYTKTGNVYGGYSNSQAVVSGNEVSISGGETGDVTGGESGSGSVIGNKVTIDTTVASATDVSVQRVYGGKGSGSAEISGNEVAIRGSKTTVNISGKAFGADGVYGGHSSGSGTVSKNTVTISNGATVNGHEVYGGFSIDGDVGGTSEDKGNTVTVSDSTVSGFVMGGRSRNRDANYNSATVNNSLLTSSVDNKFVQGGRAGVADYGNGTANSNTVTINGSTITATGSSNYASIYGGRSTYGTAASNTVTIIGTTITTLGENTAVSIYGGASDKATGSQTTACNNNTVNLLGASVIDGKGSTNIYGSNETAGTGNELHIGGVKGSTATSSDNIWKNGTTNKVSSVNNFATIALHDVAWSTSVPALYAGKVSNVGTLDITSMKLYDGTTEKTTFTADEVMDLLKSDTDLSALKLKYNSDPADTVTTDGVTIATRNNTNWTAATDLTFSGDQTDKVKLNDTGKAIVYSVAEANTVKSAVLSATLAWNSSDTYAYYKNEKNTFTTGTTFDLSGFKITSDSALTENPVNKTMTLISGSVLGTTSQPKAVPSMDVSVTQANVVLDGTTSSGTAAIGDGKLTYKVTGVTLNSVTVNGAENGAVPDGWVAGTGKIEVAAGTSYTAPAAATTILSGTDALQFTETNTNIAEDIKYKVGAVESEATAINGTTLTYAQSKGIKADGTNLVYAVGSTKDVTTITLGKVKDPRDMSGTDFDFAGTTKVDASNLELDITPSLDMTSPIVPLVTNAANLKTGVTVDYGTGKSNHSQDFSLTHGATGIVVGVTMTGIVATMAGESAGTVNYVATGATMNSLDLANWNGTDVTEDMSKVKGKAGGVTVTTGSFAEPTTVGKGEHIDIITTTTANFFGEVTGDKTFTEEVFADDTAKGVTLSGNKFGGVKATNDNKVLTYYGETMGVENVAFGTMDWGTGRAATAGYDFTKVTAVDASGLEFTKPEEVTGSMDLLTNATNLAADVAVNYGTGKSAHSQMFNKTLDNKAVISATLTGTVDTATAGKVSYTSTGISMSKFDLAGWDGATASAVPTGWTKGATVTVDTGSTVLDLTAGTDILTSEIGGLFTGATLSGVNDYNDTTNNKHAFASDTDKGVTLDGNQIKGVKASDDGKNLVYAVDGTKNVTTITLGKVNTKDPRDMSGTDFDFAGTTKVDASNLELEIESPVDITTAVVPLVTNATNLAAGVAVDYGTGKTSHSQDISFTHDDTGIGVGATLTGTVATVTGAVNYNVTGATLNSVDLANWKGTAAGTLPAVVKGTGVTVTTGSFTEPSTVGKGKFIDIIITDTENFFGTVSGDKVYTENAFADDTANGITLSGNKFGGVKATNDNKVLTYYGETMGVENVAFGTMDWGTGRAATAGYDFTKVTAVDASGLEFTKPEEVTGSMDLLTDATNLAAGATVNYGTGKSSHSQEFDKTLDNKAVITATLTGSVDTATAGKISYTSTGISMSKFDLAGWDGAKASAVPTGWTLADGATIETDGMTVPELEPGKHIDIIQSGTDNFFANATINGANVYDSGNPVKFEEEDGGITFAVSQSKGVTLNTEKKHVIYAVGTKDVNTATLAGEINWDTTKAYYTNKQYTFTDSSQVKFAGDAAFTSTTDPLNQSMTLLAPDSAEHAVKGTVSGTPGFTVKLNNTTLEATATGTAAIDSGNLKYTVNSVTLNQVNVAAVGSDAVPAGWSAATSVTVDTENMTVPGEVAYGTPQNILTADSAIFTDDSITGKNKYGATPAAFADTDNAGTPAVTIAGQRDQGVKASTDGKSLVYEVGTKDASSVTLGSIQWASGTEVMDGSNVEYDYTAVTSLGTDGFAMAFDAPETVDASKGESMTLLKANATLKDMAEQVKQSSYSYNPVSGVTVDAAITGKLTTSSGVVTYTPIANQASKLTFTNVEWKDSGALMTRPANITFAGADVDTAKINFHNIQELAANSRMTLVSDFGETVGTITGDTFTVGSGLKGEGAASLSGTDLIFTAKTGAESLTPTEATHETVMAMEAGTAVVAAGREYVDSAVEGLGLVSNMAPDGTSTFASMGGGVGRYKTGSHVDTHTWSAVVAVGSKREHKKGNLEWGVFAEYGRGNYTLHDDNGGRGDGNTNYAGGGLLAKWTNKHDVYTEASVRMGRMSDSASNMLRDALGNAYGYNVHANYFGAHVGLGKIIKVKKNRDLDVYGKYFYLRRNGVDFDAGGNHYTLDSVASSLLRIGARYGSNDKKWNWYGGLAYEYEFGGESRGTVDGLAIRSASIKGGSVRGEIGMRMDTTKTNPWKVDISIYGYGGKHRGFGGNVSVAYMF